VSTIEIKINKDWQITTDGEFNVILQHRVTRERRKTGEKYVDYEIAGYFGTPQTALKEVLRRELHGPGLKTLIQIVTRINEVYADIDKALERHHDFIQQLFSVDQVTLTKTPSPLTI